MGKDILIKVRKLNWMLQESGSGVFSFNDFCGILSDLMDANVYITNKRGKVIGVKIYKKSRKKNQAHQYEAVQLAFGEIDERKVTKPLKGHFDKDSTRATRVLTAPQ